MTDFVAQRIGRQLEYLAGLSDEEFLFAVGDVLRSLEGDPEIAIHVADLCHEADDLGKELQAEEYDHGHAGRILGTIWEKLGATVVGQQQEGLLASNSEFHTLHDDLNHPLMVPFDPNGGGEDGGRIGRMLTLIDELEPAKALPEVRTTLENVRNHQGRAQRRMLRLTRANPGVALLRLRCLTDLDEGGGFRQQANSCPRNPDDLPSLAVSFTTGERRWDGLLDELLAGRRDLSDFAAAPPLVAALRGAAARVGIELEGRIRTVRSRLALISRYKARCEWHDRERLQELADQAERKRESVLRDDLALFLFDKGLNPISEASLGTHARGDLFHPDSSDSFFLEAKQYSDGAGLKSALRSAFGQALDTAGTLRGSGFEADEAFIALFRRGGPRAILPTAPVEADGIRWYFFLINIAPPDKDASKNKETPVEYGLEELREILFEARAQGPGGESGESSPRFDSPPDS